MKKGKYGLDAPAIVIGYFVLGVLLLIIFLFLPRQSWLICLGILCFIMGLYMVYSSKIGKYKMRDKILQRLSLTGNEISLDVGCGRGLLLHGVAKKLKTGKAYGIDIWNLKDESGNNYDAVMQNAKLEGTEAKVEVINSDMRSLPFEDNYFDVIVSSLAIHNLKNNSERKKALQEIARVSKIGCKLAILDIAYIKYYKSILQSQGFDIEYVDQFSFQICPPCKVLYARKNRSN